MDLKKFLKVENMAYLAAGWAAGKSMSGGLDLRWEKPEPRPPGVTLNGCKTGELNVMEMNRRMRDL